VTIGATEDAASRRPAERDGTTTISPNPPKRVRLNHTCRPADNDEEVRKREIFLRGARRRGLHRSLTLLQVFLGASAVILVAGALALGWILTQALRSEALQAERTSLAQYVDGVVGPAVVRHNRIVTTTTLSGTILRALRAQQDVVTVKVWRADGTLAWTNRDPSRIGRRFPLDGDLGEAIRSNSPVAGIVGTGGAGEDENAVERKLGYSQLFQVYAPLDNGARTRAIGAYEIYADPVGVQHLIGRRARMIWVVVGIVFLTLYAALTLLVRGASRTLRRQTDELRDRSSRLMESYRLLEESALEAVESLNATVDAKDSYTAGHSQRVQRIALRIGQELGLTSDRLDALRFSGLFHDIGKLRVPDAILSKPAALTPDEYEVIRRHPEDGATIVGHLGRLRETVPLIRHHHERWDGTGYPDRLAGDAIPVGAAIVGLADAWDAMTTERPYSAALTVEQAAAEIRAGRGTQFSPEVVDAFFAALRRQPGMLAASEPPSAALRLTGS
jgi:putative nucleotidyltransferase with HDIG domain